MRKKLPVVRSLKLEAIEFYRKHLLMRELHLSVNEINKMSRSDIEIHYDILLLDEKELPKTANADK